MNPQLNQPVNLPQPDWDRILKWTALILVVVTGLSLVSRARTIIILAEVIDVVVILGLLAFATYGLIARYTAKVKDDAKTDLKP